MANILRKEIENRDLKEQSKELNGIIKIAEDLEPHVSLSRYPCISGGEVWLPSKEYTREIAESALKDATKALKTGKNL